MLRSVRNIVRHFLNYRRGSNWVQHFPLPVTKARREVANTNPLEQYFDSVSEGHGIYKWRHYFELYHRHLCRFVGREIHLIEVGIFSGGSLPMWRSYLGDQSRIIGIDIEPACRQYKSDGIDILIGDQGDRQFWADVRKSYPSLDVLIDDGGHTPEQQMTTLEEMLPHLQPGGVFICEDVHGNPNGFSYFVAALCAEMHAAKFDGRSSSKVSAFQSSIASIHIYPFMVIIEKTADASDRFVSERHGTLWQPFL
jgi:hypothetical protein